MQISALKKLIIVLTVVFCSYNFTVLAETATFNTVTEALNYTGNKATVTKLVITGKISGKDYSESSEWSKFRTLNETFPNIEEVEILTNQDIPDYQSEQGGLFVYGAWQGSDWLKNFSAPNVKKIGNNAFRYCSNLTSVNFPLIAFIGENAFYNCQKLVSATFGIGFTYPTTINFGTDTFERYDSLTKNIDLTLGENVLPKPNLTAKTWQDDNGNGKGKPYIWKSITIKTDGIEEIIKNAIVSFELEKSCNVKIVLCDILGVELANVYDGFAN